MEEATLAYKELLLQQSLPMEVSLEVSFLGEKGGVAGYLGGISWAGYGVKTWGIEGCGCGSRCLGFYGCLFSQVKGNYGYVAGFRIDKFGPKGIITLSHYSVNLFNDFRVVGSRPRYINYKYFEMNHAVEAFIILPGGVDTMEGLFTLISWASEGLHNRPIGLLNIDGYFNNLLKFLDDAVRQNFMALNQMKLFISSFFVDELLDKLEFAKAVPGPEVSYDEFVNPGRLDLELHL
ncbi:hypothetical protein DM860_014048 [Cuscuta australis]|uniref:cytokinin riboside 5'-monophosphate phosphoribohydrolase n=1 Tax=Cuscuta australis TaxID=267555 RepID=A0A328DNG9_9ASTE|nr:hypothetical protein DM860_014048 [Cuscuta australis]